MFATSPLGVENQHSDEAKLHYFGYWQEMDGHVFTLPCKQFKIKSMTEPLQADGYIQEMFEHKACNKRDKEEAADYKLTPKYSLDRKVSLLNKIKHSYENISEIANQFGDIQGEENQRILGLLIKFHNRLPNQAVQVEKAIVNRLSEIM